jgi:hypothetical protein
MPTAANRTAESRPGKEEVMKTYWKATIVAAALVLSASGTTAMAGPFGKPSVTGGFDDG